MGEDKSRSVKEATRKAREERLAAALRANLRRRKAGARDRPESPGSAPRENREKPEDERK